VSAFTVVAAFLLVLLMVILMFGLLALGIGVIARMQRRK
jgi:hypothetical protein